MADVDSRDGHRYAGPEVLRWLDSLHCAHDAPLARAFAAPDEEGMPAIQVGVAEGRLLELLARLVGAKRAVEVGTLAGYSAIRIARGLAPGGRLYSLERDPHHARVARARIAEAGLGEVAEIIEGDARESLEGLSDRGPFDLVFLDGDKGSYDLYGRWAAKNLRPGGLLLGDNAYFFGRLLDDEDRDALAMRRFHQEAAERFDTTTIPTPDGLLLGIAR